jgi:hypothetical protein
MHAHREGLLRHTLGCRSRWSGRCAGTAKGDPDRGRGRQRHQEAAIRNSVRSPERQAGVPGVEHRQIDHGLQRALKAADRTPVRLRLRVQSAARRRSVRRFRQWRARLGYCARLRRSALSSARPQVRRGGALRSAYAPGAELTLDQVHRPAKSGTVQDPRDAHRDPRRPVLPPARRRYRREVRDLRSGAGTSTGTLALLESRLTAGVCLKDDYRARSRSAF